MSITNSPGYNRHYRDLDLINEEKPVPKIQLHDYSPDPQAQGDCRQCGHEQNRPWHRLTRYRNINDGFVGLVIGEYETLEGKQGVVLQQVDTKVVHVYSLKYLTPEIP